MHATSACTRMYKAERVAGWSHTQMLTQRHLCLVPKTAWAGGSIPFIMATSPSLLPRSVCSPAGNRTMIGVLLASLGVHFVCVTTWVHTTECMQEPLLHFAGHLGQQSGLSAGTMPTAHMPTRLGALTVGPDCRVPDKNSRRYQPGAYNAGSRPQQHMPHNHTGCCTCTKHSQTRAGPC